VRQRHIIHVVVNVDALRTEHPGRTTSHCRTSATHVHIDIFRTELTNVQGSSPRN